MYILCVCVCCWLFIILHYSCIAFLLLWTFFSEVVLYTLCRKLTFHISAAFIHNFFFSLASKGKMSVEFIHECLNKLVIIIQQVLTYKTFSKTDKNMLTPDLKTGNIMPTKKLLLYIKWSNTGFSNSLPLIQFTLLY